MKSLLVLCVLAGVALATNTDVDFSTVKPIHQIPEFLESHKAIANLIKENEPAIKKPDGFILGGEIAEQGTFPYSAGIITHMQASNGWCSGSLVSDLYVLTAAHCIDTIQSAIVILGGTNITNPVQPGQTRVFTQNLIWHGSYNGDYLYFDIGLIRFPNSVTFSDVLAPVRLPNLRQVGTTFAGQEGTSIGWGETSNSDSTISNDLRYGRASIITNLSCLLSWPASLEAEHVCISNDSGVGTPCNGDNGGSLTVLDADGITTQIGLYTIGSILGCENTRPSIFLRTSHFLIWIGQNSNVIIREDW